VTDERGAFGGRGLGVALRDGEAKRVKAAQSDAGSAFETIGRGCYRPEAAGRDRPLWSTLRLMNQEPARPLVHSQQWKLWLAAAAVAGVATAYFLPEGATAALSLRPVMLKLVATAIGLGVMFVAWTSVRCPNCGLRLVWHAMSTNSANDWLRRLLDAKSCPKCGYHPPPGA